MHDKKIVFSDIVIDEDDTVHDVRFYGKSGEYFKIWIVNFLLTVLTLGIYSAWATVRKRRYFYGNTDIGGSHFDYHAVPLNLLLSRIIVAGFILLYVVSGLVHPILQLGFLLVLLILSPYFILRAWRFNALMSSFRNIRFNYHCRFAQGYRVILVMPFLLISLLVIAVISGGVGATLLRCAGPDGCDASGSFTQSIIQMIIILIGVFLVFSVQAKKIYDLFFNQLFYGTQPFAVQTELKKFFQFYGVAVLIFLPFICLSGSIMWRLMMTLTLAHYYQLSVSPVSLVVNMVSIYLIFLCGLIVTSVYLRVAVIRYVSARISVGKMLRFRSDISLFPYLLLVITNSLIVIFTLGFGTPVAQIRHARYMAENMKVIGDMSLAMVSAHDENKSSAIQDEIVSAFDIGVSL